MGAARDIPRSRLLKRLAGADPEAFCSLLWGASLLSAGHVDKARLVLRVADSAIPQDGIGSEVAIHPWELETLFNLYGLARPATQPRRQLSCVDYGVLFPLIGDLRKLENAEFGQFSRHQDIFQEVSRITRRQFPWQRGYDNVAQHLRSAYLFNNETCTDYFIRSYGLSYSDFTLAGFAVFANFSQRPRLGRVTSYDVLGLSRPTMASALRRLALPIEQLGQTAKKVRTDGPIAYQRSLLRDTPLMEFPEGWMAPIPVLIEARTTSGVYYDVVKGGGAVSNEIGHRFESYARELIAASMPGLQVSPEYRYGPRKTQVDTPDLLIEQHGSLCAIVECKAKRMSHEERYGGKELDGIGLGEVSRGIVQIWRFASDVRSGRTRPHRLSPTVVGLVLTLDEWGGIAGKFLESALTRAGAAADANPNILPRDRIPIALSQIEDLEITLERSTEDAFLEGLRQLSTRADRPGWQLRDTLRDAGQLEKEPKPYALRDRIEQFLPWWTLDDTGSRPSLRPSP